MGKGGLIVWENELYAMGKGSLMFSWKKGFHAMGKESLMFRRKMGLMLLENGGGVGGLNVLGKWALCYGKKEAQCSLGKWALCFGKRGLMFWENGLYAMGKGSLIFWENGLYAIGKGA